jgi:hypothetical protein
MAKFPQQQSPPINKPLNHLKAALATIISMPFENDDKCSSLMLSLLAIHNSSDKYSSRIDNYDIDPASDNSGVKKAFNSYYERENREGFSFDVGVVQKSRIRLAVVCPLQFHHLLVAMNNAFDATYPERSSSGVCLFCVKD